MSLRTIYLFYFPRVKEPFPNRESPTYGRWCFEAFRDVGSFRSVKELYEYLESENNRFYFGVRYKLINGLPKHENLNANDYNQMFKKARPLSVKRFNKVMKLKFKKKGDSNSNKT